MVDSLRENKEINLQANKKPTKSEDFVGFFEKSSDGFLLVQEDFLREQATIDFDRNQVHTRGLS